MKVLAKVCRSFAPVTQFKSGAFSINTGTDNTITSTDGTGTDTGGIALDWNCTDVLELVPMVLALVLTVLAVVLAMALKNVMDLPETSVRRSVQKLKKEKTTFLR